MWCSVGARFSREGLGVSNKKGASQQPIRDGDVAPTSLPQFPPITTEMGRNESFLSRLYEPDRCVYFLKSHFTWVYTSDH